MALCDKRFGTRGLRWPRLFAGAGFTLGGLALASVATIATAADPSPVLNPVAPKPPVIVSTATGAVADSDAVAAIESDIQSVLSLAWADATATWKKVLGRRRYEIDRPQINFVPDIRPSHCYGLYVGTGPVYCSGNNTVFVSLSAMTELAGRIDATDNTGLAILVAHELGHHIQKMTGRFRVLSQMARAMPEDMRALSLKFELEADCLAGVWARQSGGFGARVDVREDMRAALAAIGDDRIQIADRGVVIPAQFTHGSADQRRRWFNAGFESGDRTVCSIMERDRY